MKNIGLKLQFILSIIVVIVLLIGMFVDNLNIIIYSVMSLLLFVLCYNNYKTYKRKYMSPIYFIFGIIVLVKVIMECING